MTPKTQFDEFAKEYKSLLDQSVITLSGEDSAYFAEYKARYIARFVAPNFSGTLLDFGCGVGLLSGALKKYLPASVLHGYDVSDASIRSVDRALASQGLFTSDVRKLDYDYKLIVVANVFHHVTPERRREVVLELTERISPGGKLVVFEHNPANPVTRWAVDRCPFDKGAVLLWPREVSTYLGDAKLRLVRKDYIVFMPRALSWLRPFERFLCWLPLGAQYALVGEKDA